MHQQTAKGEPVGLAGHSEGAIVIKNAATRFADELRSDSNLSEADKQARLNLIHILLMGGGAYTEGLPKVGSVFQLYHQNDPLSQTLGAGAESSGKVRGFVSRVRI